MSNNKTLEKTLEDRGSMYGEFKDIAKISQALKDCMKSHTNGLQWSKLSPDKQEALEMIQHKIARILVGNSNYTDNWHDIQGYAKLAEDRCLSCHTPVPPPAPPCTPLVPSPDRRPSDGR